MSKEDQQSAPEAPGPGGLDRVRGRTDRTPVGSDPVPSSRAPEPAARRQFPSLLLLLAAVVAGCVGAYGLLRVPVIREELLALVPHRYKIEKSMQRRLLAPRSILLAGACGAGLIALALASRKGRASLSQIVPPGRRAATLFVGAQSLLAVAAVINVQAYYLRTFGVRPIWSVGEEEILRHDAPHAWPHALQLKAMLPRTARVAVRVPPADLATGGGDKFMLHAFAYPIALFDTYPSRPDWRADLDFARLAEQYRLNTLLDYHQFDAQNPLRVEPLR